ncbi:MAG TPA: hypothetical protein VHU41_19180, partial [Thermoanaerobaculia bacterium]|nr:hypothetical protein [Thermoanaerobaculia bacterium]
APLADIRDALTKPEDRKFIERSIKAEIIAAKFGFDASYPYRLEGDTQVEKALEVLPQAQKLASLAADVEAKDTHNGDATNRSAQATPKIQ